MAWNRQTDGQTDCNAGVALCEVFVEVSRDKIQILAIFNHF